MELNRMTCKKVVVSHETLGSEHLRLYSVRPIITTKARYVLIKLTATPTV